MNNDGPWKRKSFFGCSVSFCFWVFLFRLDRPYSLPHQAVNGIDGSARTRGRMKDFGGSKYRVERLEALSLFFLSLSLDLMGFEVD